MENPTIFFITGVVVIIFSLPIVFKLQKKGAYIHKSQKIIEEARKNGRTVEGRLLKKFYSSGIPGSDKQYERDATWFCHYEYTIDGKTYNYKTQTGSEPPEQVTFYYPEGKPRKAIPEGSFQPGTKVVFLTVLPIIIWVILYKIIIYFI